MSLPLMGKLAVALYYSFARVSLLYFETEIGVYLFFAAIF